MPFIVHMHCCNFCTTMFRSETEALACEALGEPTDPVYLDGTEIDYENEDGGVRWIYSSHRGKVLHTRIGNIGDQHRRIYIVEDLHYHREVEVALLDSDYGRRLFSPAEWKYNPGYASHMKQLRG